MSLCGKICNTCFFNFDKFNFNTILHRINDILFDNNINNNSSKMPINVEYHNDTNSILIDDKVDDEETLHPDFDAIVKSILITRAKEGATIEEIRGDYYNIIGETFPYFENTTERLLQLPHVMCTTNEYGTRIFNILSSDKSQHLIKMVQHQKPTKHNNNNNNNNNIFINKNYNKMNFHGNKKNRNQYNNYNQSLWRSPVKNNNSIGNDYGNQHENCFFEDNYQFLRKFGQGSYETLCNRYSIGGSSSDWSYNSNGSNQQLLYPNDEESTAHIYDYQLIGDDFFLAMAKMELGCRYNIENGVQQSGLCISGQTIKEANNRIKTINKINRRLIINIGSVDILQGHHLIDLQDDLINLLYTLELRGCRPIITTLAPLANHGHRPEIKRILERFNEFIRNLGIPYIDIWKSMANEYSNTLYNCYQSGARHVTGSQHPHVFWNSIGRQRVLNNIKADLEYLPLN